MRALNHIPLIVVLAYCALFSGCSDPTGGDANTLPIEGRIGIEIREGYSGYDREEYPQIYLSLNTEIEQPCINYRIETSIELLHNTIVVSLAGMIVPRICFDAIGPATSRNALPLPEGRYNFDIRLNGKSDSYRLDVNDSAIALEPIRANFTYSENYEYWRYPENTFAFVCGTFTTDTMLYYEFADSLRHLPHVAEFALGNQMVSPYPSSSQGYYRDFATKLYRYEVEADFDSAGALLQRFVDDKIRGTSGNGIYLLNWRSKQYMSWLME